MKFTCFLLLFFFSLLNCKDEKRYKPKEFIDEFFNQNSQTIFLDEIERVKVNYFKESNFLIYTFKNRRKLNKDGTLFLRLLAKDSSDLPKNRKSYGSVNLSINKKEVFHFNETRNLLIKKLQFPYDIKSIITGHNKNKKKTWKASHFDSLTLSNNRLNTLNVKNEESLIFKKFTSLGLPYGNIGIKVYSTAEKKIQIYYNPNTQCLTTYFGDLTNNIDENYKVKIKLKDGSIIEQNIDLNNILKNKKSGLSFITFKQTNIKSISLSQKDWNKTIDIYSLIHYTHVKRLNSTLYNKSSNDDRVFILINYLLENTLKNLSSDNNSLDIYANGNKENIYIKTTNSLSKDLIVRVHNKKQVKNTNFYFSKRKKLITKDFEIFTLKLPSDSCKVEFGFINNNTFNTFFSFEK